MRVYIERDYGADADGNRGYDQTQLEFEDTQEEINEIRDLFIDKFKEDGTTERVKYSFDIECEGEFFEDIDLNANDYFTKAELDLIDKVLKALEE